MAFHDHTHLGRRPPRHLGPRDWVCRRCATAGRAEGVDTDAAWDPERTLYRPNSKRLSVQTGHVQEGRAGRRIRRSSGEKPEEYTEQELVCSAWWCLSFPRSLYSPFYYPNLCVRHITMIVSVAKLSHFLDFKVLYLVNNYFNYHWSNHFFTLNHEYIVPHQILCTVCDCKWFFFCVIQIGNTCKHVYGFSLHIFVIHVVCIKKKKKERVNFNIGSWW